MAHTEAQLDRLDELILRDDIDVLEAVHYLTISVWNCVERGFEHAQCLIGSLVAVGMEDELPAGFEEWYEKPEEFLVTLVV